MLRSSESTPRADTECTATHPTQNTRQQHDDEGEAKGSYKGSYKGDIRRGAAGDSAAWPENEKALLPCRENALRAVTQRNAAHATRHTRHTRHTQQHSDGIEVREVTTSRQAHTSNAPACTRASSADAEPEQSNALRRCARVSAGCDRADDAVLQRTGGVHTGSSCAGAGGNDAAGQLPTAAETRGQTTLQADLARVRARPWRGQRGAKSQRMEAGDGINERRRRMETRSRPHDVEDTRKMINAVFERTRLRARGTRNVTENEQRSKKRRKRKHARDEG